MSDDTQGPPVTVYLSARICAGVDRATARRQQRGRMVHCWSLKLQRWSPDEVYEHIVKYFTQLANEEAVDGQR